LTKDCKPTAIN